MIKEQLLVEQKEIQQKIKAFKEDRLQELISMYNESIDESNKVEIFGNTYSASKFLKTVDEIAYHLGFNIFVDNCENEFDLTPLEELQEQLKIVENKMSETK
jgi:hypothetical protein